MNLRFYFLLALQLLVAIALLVLVVLWPGPWDVSRGIGSVLVVLGVALVLTARFQLGNSFSVTPQAKALVTHGLYSKIRNPIYVFGIAVILGLVLIFHHPNWGLFLALLIPIQILRARQEAKVLEAKFGDRYREYRRKTWF